MAYQLFCQSVIGQRHINEGSQKEDYGIVEQGEGYKLFALGDGHGDPNCMRSRIGSEYVCRVAADKLRTFAAIVQAQGLAEAILDKKRQEPIIRQLIRSIIGTWGRMVNEELKQNPITEEEEKQATTYIARYKRGQKLEHIYGTTLIAGLLTDDYLLLLQQGDGRCEVFDANGNVSQPIPWDDRCIANICTSICESDAVESCRYHVIDPKVNPVISVIAGSDGVEDSFNSMDKVHAFYREKLIYACEHGVDGLVQHLADTLPEFNAKGSQDDTTVCGFVDLERTSTFIQSFLRENQKVDLNDTVAQVDERLSSMQAKLSHLQKQFEAAAALYEEKKKQYEDVSIEYAPVEQDLAAVEAMESREGKSVLSKITCNVLKRFLATRVATVEKATKELEDAKIAKEKAEAQYLPYKQKYDDFMLCKEEALARIKQIGQEE